MARRRNSSGAGIVLLISIIFGLVLAFIKLYKKSPAAAIGLLVIIVGFVAIAGSGTNTTQTPSTQSTYTSPSYLSSPSPTLSALPINKGSNNSRKSQGSGSVAGSSDSDYYTNVDGERVSRPTRSNSVPAGASAQCADGTYSFSRHRRGTCSHHGGVAQWLD
jgi:hypothetical protein